MSRLLDVTRPLWPGLPAFPGDPPFRRTETVETLGDCRLRLSSLTLSAHAGTHVDAPRHVWPTEAEVPGPAVHELAPEVLVGPARVVDVRGVPAVTAAHVQAVGPAPPRLLFRTDNSFRRYSTEQYVAFTPEAASALLSRAPLLVGIDGPSLDLPGALDLPVHRLLLTAGIVGLEGLDLARAAPGDCEVICLPLLIRDGEGAPARVLLRPDATGPRADRGAPRSAS